MTATYDFDAMGYNPYAVRRSIVTGMLEPSSFVYAATPQGLEFWAVKEGRILGKEEIGILSAMEELYADLRLAHKMAGMM